MKKPKPSTGFEVERIPPTMCSARRWLNWRAVERDDKWTKVPCNAAGWKIDPTNPANGRTFADARDAATASSSDGGSREEQALHGGADRSRPRTGVGGPRDRANPPTARRVRADFSRWMKKFGATGVAEVRRLKQLEDENAKLKRLFTDLSLDKEIQRDLFRKRSDARPAPRAGLVRTRRLSGHGAPCVPRAVHVAGDDPLRVRQGRTRGIAYADQGDRRGAPELGLSADPGASASRGLAGQPHANGAPASHGRPESRAKSPTAQEARRDSRPIGRADAPG